MLKNYQIKEILDHRGYDKRIVDGLFYDRLVGGFVLNGEFLQLNLSSDYYFKVYDCISRRGATDFSTSIVQEVAVSETGKQFDVVDCSDWNQNFQQNFLRITTKNSIYILERLSLDKFAEKNIVTLMIDEADSSGCSFVGFIDYDDQKNVPLVWQKKILQELDGEDDTEYVFSIYGQKEILFKISNYGEYYIIVGQLNDIAIKLINIGECYIEIRIQTGEGDDDDYDYRRFRMKPDDEMIIVNNKENGLVIFPSNQYNEE